jgi:hypothetical protein
MDVFVDDRAEYKSMSQRVTCMRSSLRRSWFSVGVLSMVLAFIVGGMVSVHHDVSRLGPVLSWESGEAGVTSGILMSGEDVLGDVFLNGGKPLELPKPIRVTPEGSTVCVDWSLLTVLPEGRQALVTVAGIDVVFTIGVETLDEKSHIRMYFETRYDGDDSVSLTYTGHRVGHLYQVYQVCVVSYGTGSHISTYMNGLLTGVASGVRLPETVMGVHIGGEHMVDAAPSIISFDLYEYPMSRLGVLDMRLMSGFDDPETPDLSVTQTDVFDT